MGISLSVITHLSTWLKWPVQSNAVRMGRGHHSLVCSHMFVDTVCQHCLWKMQSCLSLPTSSSLTSPWYLLLHICKRSCEPYSGLHGETSYEELISAWISISTQFSKQPPELLCQPNRGGSSRAEIWWPEARSVWHWSFWQPIQITLV